MQQMIKSDVKFELWTIHFGLEKEKQKKQPRSSFRSLNNTWDVTLYSGENPVSLS